MIRPHPDAPSDFVPFHVLHQYMESQNRILSEMQSKLENLSTRMTHCENKVDGLSRMHLATTPALPPPAALPKIQLTKRKEHDEESGRGDKVEIQSSKFTKNTVEKTTETVEIYFEELKISPLCFTEVVKCLGEAASPEKIITLTKSTRITDKEGKLLCIFIRNAIDYKKHHSIFFEMENMKNLKKGSNLRGFAAGKFDASTHNKKESQFRVSSTNGLTAVSVTIQPDGSEKLGTYRVGNHHPSITLGYLGHPRTRKRLCGPTRNTYPELVNKLIPLCTDVSEVYKKYAPEQFQHQYKLIENHRTLAEIKALKHFQIGKTPFTSVTVNETYKGKPTTYFHLDSQNVDKSFVCITTNSDDYEGGETVLANFVHPESGKMISFKLLRGDLLLFDGNKTMHGNTPVLSGSRISYVFYAHALLTQCDWCKSGQSLEQQSVDDEEFG